VSSKLDDSPLLVPSSILSLLPAPLSSTKIAARIARTRTGTATPAPALAPLEIPDLDEADGEADVAGFTVAVVEDAFSVLPQVRIRLLPY